jgi:hypothetical protein
MCQNQSQTPTLQDFFAYTYICERELLERKIRELNEKLKTVSELYRRAVELLKKMFELFGDSVTYLELDKLKRAIRDLGEIFSEAVENMIYYKIPYSRDTEKFEKAFNVKFVDLQSELGAKILGVVLVKENDKVEPVAIFVDYVMPTVGYMEGEREVGYIEGEKNE